MMVSGVLVIARPEHQSKVRTALELLPWVGVHVVAASVAGGLGIWVSPEARAKALDQDLKWDKAVCRFCGVGCGIMIATRKGRVVAVKGGYAAVKFMKAGVRSTNIDPNSRYCIASAVAAFAQTFGIDESPGCYGDIEVTDALVCWGANMAESHPILWSRITDRKSTQEKMKIVNLSTFGNRTSDVAGSRFNCTICHTPQAINVKTPGTVFPDEKQNDAGKESR